MHFVLYIIFINAEFFFFMEQQIGLGKNKYRNWPYVAKIFFSMLSITEVSNNVSFRYFVANVIINYAQI